MKAGKLQESVLKRSVLKQLHSVNEHTKAGAAIGADCASVSVAPGEVVVLSIDPITEAADQIGRLAVISALNDVAAGGAKPIGVLISLLLPTSMNEVELRALIRELDETCIEAGAQILGGHTEVTRLVKEPLVTVTGVGVAGEKTATHCDGVKPGMDILVTKWIGLEGTMILANEKEEELRNRYAQPFLDKAKAFSVYLPIWSEAAVAVRSGASAMHNVSEGGIFGALWEMAQSSGVGLEIDLKKIPIRQETVEICEFFDLNPYKLISGGCLLLAASDGNAVLRALEAEGICASIIGKATDGNDRVLLSEGERRFLETTQTDEIHRVIR